MAEVATKSPVKAEKKQASPTVRPGEWRPFESLRREVDRLFDEFDGGFGRLPTRRSLFDLEPIWRRQAAWPAVPAVDVTEKENAYEITAELPGMDDKNVELKLANGVLTIKGEKTEEKEEKKKDYHLSERRYGSFERAFQVPDGVDADKIEASFKKGVLTITLPKTPQAQAKQKKIAVKAG